jgi:hypothetical protein
MVHPHVNPVEARRQAVQAELDTRRSAAERNRLGQFATPHALAVEIASYVQSLIGRSLPAIHFADPCFGTGSFYSAARLVFGTERIARALGVEIDSAVCDAARGLWDPTDLEIISGDFTCVVARAPCLPSPNLILANPPYVRHHHLGRDDKQRLRTLVRRMAGVEVNGLAGLYVYFLLLATAWMEDDGYAAWLIPSEFMDVNYGTALKRFLTERVTLLRLHRFDPDDSQFGDALVSSVVLVFRKAPPPHGQATEFSFGGTLGTPQARATVPVEQLHKARKWTAYPIHATNDRQTCTEKGGPTLGDLFRIQRGIATGSNKFFILDRAFTERCRFPERYLRPILPSPRYLRTTVIDADDKGDPLIDGPLCVIDCDLPETVLQERHPSLWEYLQTAEALGIKNGYLVGKRTPWYKQERREPAPFLCTYMGRGSAEKRPFRFIWNRSHAICTNLYLMLYPRNELAAMLRRHSGRAKDVFALLSQVTGSELRGEGRVYGGGLNKIEPNELARISAAPFVRQWPELAATVCRQGELFE